MTDKIVYGVAETGTYLTTFPNPHVDLDGTSPSNVSISQLFFDALSDQETVTVTVRKDADNWACFGHASDAAGTVGAEFGAGSTNSLFLQNANLLDSKGSLSSGDAVDVVAEYPEQDTGGWVDGSTVLWNVNTRQVITTPGTYPLTNGQTIRCTPSSTGTFNFTTPAITGDDTYSMDLIVSPGATSPTIQINGAAPDFVQTPMPSYETAKRYRFSLFADADETMLHWAEAE